MAGKIAWKQPKAARTQEWLKDVPELKRALRTCIATWLILGAAGLYLVHRISPGDLKRTAIVIPVTAVLVTGLFTLQVVTAYMTTMYSVSRRWGPLSSRRYAWRSIDGYRFGDHPDLPGLRVLEFQADRFRRWERWAFDPEQVDESALRAMFEERLPGKCWDNVAGDELPEYPVTQ